MESNFKIQGMPSPSAQVSQFSIKPVLSSFNFISRSRILPQFRASKPRNRLHCLSLSSSPSYSPLSVYEKSSNEHSFEVSYLINTFGWPPKLAISKAKYSKFKSPDKPERVLAFFKRHRFTQTQISFVVEKYPRLLVCKPEKSILPKFGFLCSLGLSTTEVTSIVTKAPQILNLSLEKTVIPNFNLLCDLFSSYDEAVMIVKRHPMILAHYLELDTHILLEAGVPAANIVVFMSYYSIRYQYQTPTPDSFRKMVEQVKEMGFDPCTVKFLEAVWTKMVLSKSTWEDQVQVFKKYGWSDYEISFALKKLPKFLMCSKDKAEGVMDFLVNTVRIEPTTIAQFPSIFTLSFEKRMVPRYLFYLSLFEKGLYDKEFGMEILTITEARFITRFIKRYENEAPEIWDLYNSLMKLHCLPLSSPSPSTSTSPVYGSNNSSDKHSFEVSYLINTFGWPPEVAIAKAKKLRFMTPETPERMLAFLKKHGFNKTQISLMVKKALKILLVVDPEKTILPKFEYLSSLGLSETEITDVVTKAPRILNLSLEKSIIPTFNLLRSLVNSDDEAVKLINRYPTILTHYHEAVNIQILLNAGVPAKNIVLFMTYSHVQFTPPTPDKFRKMVEEVKEMGFDPCTMNFLCALSVTCKSSNKSYWENKVQVLKKCGWSDRDILLAFEKHPFFIKTSKDKIEGVMDVLVNKGFFEVADVSNCPSVFSGSLEKSIIPRCLVYQFLLEKGLLKRKPSIYSFRMAEAKFITGFIKPFEDEAPELWDIYNGKLQNGV